MSRDDEIYRRYKSGERQSSIAAAYGITSQRVSQICTAMGRAIFVCPSSAVCDNHRPHRHCKACGLLIAPEALICELCEREAHRALLVATGRRLEALRLHTVAGDEHLLARVLNPLDDDPEEAA